MLRGLINISFSNYLYIQVVLQGPVCAEEFSSCKALGRVSLRASGRTLAVGIVTRVIEKEP